MLILASLLLAWGPMGHRLVAQLAWDGLTPRARHEVTRLLDGESLADAALWADRIRQDRRDTSPLHFVNIPAGAPAYDPDRYCRQDRCVIGAVEKYRQVLADSAAPRADRREALRFLLHFVGDLHQPLHVGDKGDRGGNGLSVTWRGKSENLHALWDSGLLEAWAPSEGGYLKTLRKNVQRMPAAQRAGVAAGSVVGWAMEGNALAANVAYQARPGESLGSAYLRAAGPVLDLAIARAGLRLARMLNEALDAQSEK
jgi:hypothetical protein